MKKIFVVFILLLAQFAFSGTGTSNGGDHVRAEFIKRGQEILKFLITDPYGQSILADFKLSQDDLRATLDIRKIQSVSGPLIDDTGSIVDSQGVPGLIRLDAARWQILLSSGADIYYLIFHEMLRSAAVNDDGYPISFKLNPFFRTAPKSPAGVDLSGLNFYGHGYDSPLIEPVYVNYGVAGIYRSNKDGKLKVSIAFSENRLNDDICSIENKYSNEASTDKNPQQRIYNAYNLDYQSREPQDLANNDMWLDNAQPVGRAYFIDYRDPEKLIAVQYPSAFGEVTILDITETTVTVFINHFVITKDQSFTMHGKATIQICN